MLKNALFLVVIIVLASIRVSGQPPPYNCPDSVIPTCPAGECPGGCQPCLFCDDFEPVTISGKTGYDYTKNKTATLDSHTVWLDRASDGTLSANKQWKTDGYEGVFASRPTLGTPPTPIGLAHEAPATSDFQAATSCPPGDATGYRRSCSTTVKTFTLQASQNYRITSVMRVHRENPSGGNMKSKVAWHLQQFQITTPNTTYWLNAVMFSYQTATPGPKLCFYSEYWRIDLPVTIPSSVVCIDGAAFDPTNDFAKLATAVKLIATPNAPEVDIQVEAKDKNDNLLPNCTAPDGSNPGPCKAKVVITPSTPGASFTAADITAMTTNTAVVRIYPVVCNDTQLLRVVEIDRVSVAQTTNFE